MSKPDENRKSHTVLIIEDDPFISDMYQTKLKNNGYQVFLAADGQTGLEIAQKKQPDIIILDLVLPKMDGFQILKRIKEDSRIKNIPVLILSNLGQKEKIDKGMKLGADAYLVKSQFKPSEVLEKIKKLL